MGFIFGGDTGQTQESITDARKRMALAMIQQGADTSPIQSPWQGVARLSEALMGGLALRRQEGQQQAADAQALAIATGQPYTPPAQPSGFLSSLFGGSKVPASGAQSEVAASAPSATPAGDGGNYRDAISSIESSGNYGAVGPTSPSMGRALGKYQIMEANVGPWSQEALGRTVTPDEFLNNPQVQDAIFDHKFNQYAQKYGPTGAAQAWFAGPGGVGKLDRKDVLGTSVADYGNKFNNAMGIQGQPTQVASLDPGAGIPAPAAQAQVAATSPDPQQTASIAPNAASMPPMQPPVNVAANPVPPQGPLPSPQPQAPADGATRLAQAMQAAPQQPNALARPKAQALLRAMMNPNVSPQARQMVGAVLQQEMSRGQAAYQAQMEQYLKQQDPEYQATLAKAQYEASHLGQIAPGDAARLSFDKEKYADEKAGTWEKLDDGTLYNKRTGETKAASTPGVAGPVFKFSGGSIEGQALNGLVASGTLTVEQAQNIAAGKQITGPNGEILFMSPQGLVSQPAQATQPQPSVDIFAGQPEAPQAAVAVPAAAPVPNGATQLTGPKAPDKDEKDAAGFADRLAAAAQVIDQTGTAGASRMQNFENMVPFVGNSLVSEDFQKFDNARRNFINAQLRRESGAAIGPSEFEEGNKQYFPQPGDGPEVIQQKAAARAAAIANMRRSAGPTYKPAEQNGPMKINGYTIEKVSP